MNNIAIAICYRDRPTELALLLESLRNQTIRNFDIFIVDDNSGTPIENYHFLVCMFNKMNQEGNFITYEKNPFNFGVSKSRQKCVDLILKNEQYKYICRVDDDVILERDFLEKLVVVLQLGFDLASGVTPFIGQTQFKRETRHLKGIINRVILDKEGNFIYNGDDCGMEYLDEQILPCHHFRSSALYKREIHDKVNYSSKLTKHGFREEEIFSFKCLLNGFKLGVNTQAVAWHLMTPSGGERFSDSNELIKLNEEILKEFTKEMYKEKGDFISEYNKQFKYEELNNIDLTKPNNLRL